MAVTSALSKGAVKVGVHQHGAQHARADALQQFPRALEVAAIVLLVAGVLWSVRVHALHDPLAPA